MRPEGAPRLPLVLTAVLLAAIMALGVGLRMKDPLSGPLAAEDPYTHVVFTKESLENGRFGDSYYLGTGMYPPGIHAFSGAFAPLAGLPLYDLAVWGPVALGALAILGMFALANRLSGPVAGLVAALLTALMPEHVFRTNLFAPTAFDLALLPAWLLLFHLAITPRERELVDLPGWRSPARRAAAIAFLVLTIPLAFLHPWVVVLFGGPAALYAALQAFRGRAAPRATATRLGFAAALVALACAFAMASRWDASDTGFSGFLAVLGPLSALAAIDLPAPILFVVLLAILSALAAAAVALVVWAGIVADALPRMGRLGIAAAVAASLLVAVFAMADPLPKNVDFGSQLQPAAVLLGLVGLALALVAPSRVGDLGLSVAVLLFPFTALDVFGSEFWPQRTVVYLSIGVALLGAGAIAYAASQAGRLARTPRAARSVAPVALFASVLLVAGAVAAEPRPIYPWYRLYSTDHFEGFEHVAGLVADDPTARVVVYSWEPALMVRTLADPAQARYSREFYSDGGAREKILSEKEGDDIYVIVDKTVLKAEAAGKVDLSFLKDTGRYEVVHRAEDGAFKVYEVRR